jgi:hypothetical protein
VPSPDPATTKWVPVGSAAYPSTAGNLNKVLTAVTDGGPPGWSPPAASGSQITYTGAYDNAHTYHDGDIVVGADGITYQCVKEGTVGVVPVPWASTVSGVPTARVFRGAAVSIPSASWTTVAFDSVRWDTGAAALHWSASNPTRLTCQVAGTYAVSGSFGFMTQAGGNHRIAQICLNGSINNGLVNAGSWGATIPAGPYPYAAPTTVARLNVGDFIELWCYQDSGSAIAMNPSGGVQQLGGELAMAFVGGPKGDTGIGVPTPVVNGQWIKGVGGAAVWSSITPADVVGLGVYQNWTPALFSTTGPNPTGYARTGRYTQIGKLVHAQAQISPGASFTPGGGGSYYHSLPVTARAWGYDRIGTGFFYHAGSIVFCEMMMYASDGTAVYASYNTLNNPGTSTITGPSTPWVWGNGDDIQFSVTYEAA